MGLMQDAKDSCIAKVGSFLLMGASLPALAGCCGASREPAAKPDLLNPPPIARVVDAPLTGAALRKDLVNASAALTDFLNALNKANYTWSAVQQGNPDNVAAKLREAQSSIAAHLTEPALRDDRQILIDLNGHLETAAGIMKERRFLGKGFSGSTSDWAALLQAKGQLDGCIVVLGR